MNSMHLCLWKTLSQDCPHGEIRHTIFSHIRPMSITYFFISFSFKSQVLLEPGYYSREGLIWENKVHTVLSENFGTLQTLSHMYDVVPKWLKKCTVRALKCYLHLNLNHSVPNWTIFLANSKQNLHPFSTLLYYCNNHKSKLLSVLVASSTVLECC